MELIVRDGDYVADDTGGLCTVQGAQELVVRILFKLRARRGGFPLLPELGSQLYRLPGIKPGQRTFLARQFVAEALRDEQDLEITDVILSEEAQQGRLKVSLLWRGEPLSVETEME